MVIVDTTVWVDYFRGVTNHETEWVHAALDRQRLGLTDLILCEVLQGVRDDVAAKAVERELLKLEVFEVCGADLAREAAHNYRTLRTHGHTVSQNDRLPDCDGLYPRAALAHSSGPGLRSIREVPRALDHSRLKSGSRRG